MNSTALNPRTSHDFVAAVALVASSLLAIVTVAPVFADADGTWELVPRPEARLFFSAVHDPIGDRMVLSGGYGEDGAYHDDVWSVSLAGGSPWIEILPAGPGPGARVGHSVIYDPLRRRLIVFGGLVAPGPGGLYPPYTYANDLWALSLDGSATWSRISLATTVVPYGRQSHTAIYDPVRDRMIVFGGEESLTGAARKDVWSLWLSGTPRWTQMPSCPVPQMEHAAIYDPVRNRMVVFGSQSGGGSRDVWALSLGASPAWTKLPAPTSPSIQDRAGATAVYDAGSDRMVVFGGFDYYSRTSRSDVWAFSLGASTGWTELTPAGGSPGPRSYLSAVYDPVRARMVLTGGTFANREVWALPLAPGGQWTLLVPDVPQPPTYRYGHVAVYDPSGERMVIFGGNGVGAGDSDLWALSLQGDPMWTSLNAPGSPGIRADMVGVFDSRRRRLIIHGGAPAQTWSLALTPDLTWTRIDPASALPHHWAYHVGIYDPVRDRLVVFGGDETYCPNPEHCDYYYYREVWALNLSGIPTWTRIEPQGEPPPMLYNASAIYDPVRNRMLVYGGDVATFPYGATGSTWALTLSDTPTWSVVAEPSSPSLVRESHTAIYDARRDRMVVYGGFGNGSDRLDTWGLQLSGTPGWRQLATHAAPLARRSDHVAIYDPVNDRMVVNSGYDTRTTYLLTWGEPPTKTLVDAQAPVVSPSGVGLRWRVSTEVRSVSIFRVAGSGDWTEVAQLAPDGQGIIAWEDRDVRPGMRYGYRLALDGRDESVGSEVWVDVPAAPALALWALQNPTAGPIRVGYSLGSFAGARLELFDVSGRRVAAKEVGSSRSDRTYELTFPEASAPPGLFFVRLVQERQLRTVRVIRVR